MNVPRMRSPLLASLILLTSIFLPSLAGAQGITSLSANAKGQGTLTIGKEEFKVHNVVVTLKEDGTGEVILATDITVFVSCSWSATSNLSNGIDLKIRGGSTSGGAEGTGKLLLKPDGKSIASLSIQAINNTRQRKIKLSFSAE